MVQGARVPAGGLSSAPAPTPPPTPAPFPGGYNGKILRVNLSDKRISTEDLDPLFCRKYLGGAGFVTYYLWKELKKGADALGPDNKLIFAIGPATGLSMPGCARNVVGAKSPLTGGIAKAEVGGFWMAELKRAGFDVIIVEGKAEKPVYLWVHDGEAEIRDAGHLWGQEIKETEAAVRTELGDDHVQLATIGPAGEHLVRYACVMNGLFDAAGRGGTGAVMGSKNLKAVAVRGHKMPPIADEEKVKEIRQQLLARPAGRMSQFGTGGAEEGAVASGNLPVRNWRDGLFDVKRISGPGLKDSGKWIGMDGCFACPTRCKKVFKAEAPYLVDPAYGGPEYETVAALGSNCGVNDPDAIIKGNERCNAYSLDSISTGNAIAFAMECFEKGLLTGKDTGGIDLKFGNAEAMLKAIDLIATRQGIGDLMAEGVARMARQIAKGSSQFAVHVKGLEPGMHEPRLRPTTIGLGFMVSPIGADHCSSMGYQMMPADQAVKLLHPMGIYEPVPAGDLGPRGVTMFMLGHWNALVTDSAVVCMFGGMNLQVLVPLIAAVTGWDTSLSELMKVGERIVTTARLFNLREGLSDTDDVLPERYFRPKTDGPLASKAADKGAMDRAKGIYYSLMGWDAKGVPTTEKVQSLYIE